MMDHFIRQTKSDVQPTESSKRHTLLSWLTEAERATSLIHYAASPAFDGFQMTNDI
jgi:hypothetical protein